MRFLKASLFIFIISLTSLDSFARQGPPKYQFTLGPGVIFKRNIRFDNMYDKADKPTIVQFIPFATLNLGPFSLNGGGAQVRLPGLPFLWPSLVVARIGDRYYGPDMDRRKDSWAMGLNLKIPFISLRAIRDIQGRSHGSIYTLSLGKMFLIGPSLRIRPNIAMKYYDGKFVDYYYGVKENEVTSDRSFYAPGGSIGYSSRVMINYQIQERLSLINFFSYQILGPKVEKSPTTKTDKVVSVIIGLSYRIF